MAKSELRSTKAIIIGGSMAGLLAARVLSDFYHEVTIIERDRLLTEGGHRRGVPQSRHAHGLLASGSEVLEELFPGILAELVAAGAIPADVVNDIRWFFEGDCLRRMPSGTEGILLSRPFLESWIRQRVRAISNITIRDNCPVRELMSVNNRITGIRTEDETLSADLVVDASGRGSQSPRWLESLGFRAPREEKVGVDLAYTSHLFRRRPYDLDGDKIAIIAPTPQGKCGGVIAAQEGNIWITTLFGHFGNVAPSGLNDFIEFSKNLPAPFIYDVIRDAEPVSDACTIRFPASIRRHYEELPRFPHGFLVFGDAICSFNPIYGQGMSVAALQARTLREQLVNTDDNLARRFYKAAARVLDNPWNIAVGTDLRMPETVGRRTLGGKFINWYISKLHRFAHNDADASLAFLRVAQLLDGPTTLLRPKLVFQVLLANFLYKLGLSGKVYDRKAESSVA